MLLKSESEDTAVLLLINGYIQDITELKLQTRICIGIVYLSCNTTEENSDLKKKNTGHVM